MRMEELRDFYGSWSELSRKLGLGVNSYQYWRKIGYIPFPTQLLIENKTNGRFKASEEDAKPLD